MLSRDIEVTPDRKVSLWCIVTVTLGDGKKRKIVRWSSPGRGSGYEETEGRRELSSHDPHLTP